GHDSQADLAAAVGVQGPTLTHHLNGLEKAGLVSRTRLPDNRRVHQVALTEAGRAKFHRLRQAAMAYDTRLRQGLAEAELDMLCSLLG
uniref:MarR family winged helix-turn-helix transcriptional regulator n=1 Tax=Morganella morganii TaxID=582 RepID=UPI0013D5BE73